VALLDEHGAQLLNRNLPNDPAELVPILGALAPGTPVAFEAAYGWGWLADLLEELDLEPHLVHLGRWRTCCAPTCCPRPGSRPSRSATSAPCCATAPPWCAPGPR
jgi:hypothetical protein